MCDPQLRNFGVAEEVLALGSPSGIAPNWTAKCLFENCPLRTIKPLLKMVSQLM
jgi:hypothetical protein